MQTPFATLQAVRSIEDNVDTRLQALDNLDPDDIERLRQRRLDQMKQAAARKQARIGNDTLYRNVEQLFLIVRLWPTLL